MNDQSGQKGKFSFVRKTKEFICLCEVSRNIDTVFKAFSHCFSKGRFVCCLNSDETRESSYPISKASVNSYLRTEC